ncbi:MAG TPA: hypothetical protein VNF29_08145 [Candidatus Binataceae bacterium]|nr:hypothetical protein [Candidatus Binataceae bacterium]
MALSILYPYHVRVLVRGPSAALYAVARGVPRIVAVVAVLAAIGRALK